MIIQLFDVLLPNDKLCTNTSTCHAHDTGHSCSANCGYPNVIITCRTMETMTMTMATTMAIRRNCIYTSLNVFRK